VSDSKKAESEREKRRKEGEVCLGNQDRVVDGPGKA
jgi:hypothetical protein